MKVAFAGALIDMEPGDTMEAGDAQTRIVLTDELTWRPQIKGKDGRWWSIAEQDQGDPVTAWHLAGEAWADMFRRLVRD